MLPGRRSGGRVKEDYFSGQRKRSRRKQQARCRGKGGNPETKHKSLMPHIDKAIELQNQTVGIAETLFGMSTEASASSRVPLLNSPEIQLRFLNPDDLLEVKKLCREWFPVEYPDSWYTDITSDSRFYSVCACYRGQIIGLIVAEIKDAANLPKEDSEILASSFARKSSTRIGYILSLGVVKEFRKNGVASFLLDNLVAHLTNPEDNTTDVRALYLHVLTTNTQAISFYENRGFRPHLFLPYYYAIKGKRKDGFTYVLYLNGGHPAWTLGEWMNRCLSVTFGSILNLNPWSMTRGLMRKFLHLGGRFPIWPRLRQVAHSSTAAIFS